MHQAFRVAPLLAMLLAVSACSSTGVSNADIGYTLDRPGEGGTTMAPSSTASTSIATAQSLTDVTAFIDPQALGQLSAKERTEAASAQFNALQFGRTGAPRSWQGDRGASGQVTVGPPVNVNSLYCRDFTHTVSVGGQSYAKRGLACRELDGRWSVEQSAT